MNNQLHYRIWGVASGVLGYGGGLIVAYFIPGASSLYLGTGLCILAVIALIINKSVARSRRKNGN